MGNISTKEVSKTEEALLEALDKLMEQGESMRWGLNAIMPLF
jgi:hypothetical protein